MDALDLLRTLRRRWALALVLAIGLAALLTSLGFMVPQQYRVNASMLVLRAYGGDDRNPYAAVDPSQGQAAMMLLRVVNTPATQQRMLQQGATAKLEITNESAGSVAADSPFITIIATGDSPAEVRATAEIAMKELRAELKRKQDELGVPQEGHLTLTDVVPADTVTTTRSAQLRALAIGGAVGLALLLCIVVMVDRAQQKRAQVPFALARKTSGGGTEHEPVDPEPSVQQAAELAQAARSAVERVRQVSRPAVIDRPTDALGMRYQAVRAEDRATR